MLITVLGYSLMGHNLYRGMLLAAFGLFLGMFIRYETIGMAFTLAIAVIVGRRGPDGPFIRARDGLGGLLVLLFPGVYALFLWMLWNWLLTGNPLYFYNSVYSLAEAPDVARTVGFTHPYYWAWGDSIVTILLSLRRIVGENLAFPVVLGIIAWESARYRWTDLMGLAILLLGPAFITASQMYQGTLPPYMRYWFYVVAFTPLLVGSLMGMLPRALRAQIVLPLIAAMALGPFIYLAVSASDTSVGMDEAKLANTIIPSSRRELLHDKDAFLSTIHDAGIVAEKLDRYSANGLVIIDSEEGFAIIMASQHPERLAINSDRDFQDLLEMPWTKGVRYILVTPPDIGGPRDAIARRYPLLYQYGAPWARLVENFTNTAWRWRLYEITEPRTNAPSFSYGDKMWFGG
jgi:hypothetical protein